MKKLVYICAPYRGNIKRNIARALKYGRRAYKRGYIPFIPHVNFGFFNEETERGSVMQLCCYAVERCNEMWVFGRPTEGMKTEIVMARSRGVKIRYVKKTLTK